MATRTTLSWEQFVAAGIEGQKCEWVDGEIIQMTPVNLRHEGILARLVEYSVDYCRAHPEWMWLPSNAAFTMTSGNWRLPDASLVRRERFSGGNPPSTRADFPPRHRLRDPLPFGKPRADSAKTQGLPGERCDPGLD